MKQIRSWFSVAGLSLYTLVLRIRQTILLTALVTLLMMLMQTLLSFYGASEYRVYEMKHIWNVNADEVYHLGMAYVTSDDWEYTDRLNEYLTEAKELEGIESIGKFYWIEVDAYGQRINVLHIDEELLEFAGLELKETNFENAIYLGSYYKDSFKVGDTFDDEFTVAGFLPEGMKWPDSCRMLEGTDLAFDMDKNALVINSDEQLYDFAGFLYYQSIYFTLADGADYEMISEKLPEMAFAHNISAYVESLQELYDNYLQENDLVRGKYRMEIILALIVSVLTISTAQLISFWVLRHFYSVLYACGYSRPQMVFKSALELMFIFVFSFALSYVLVKVCILPQMSGEEYWYEAWTKIAVQQTAVVAAIVYLLGNVLPSVYIALQLPWKMLRER